MQRGLRFPLPSFAMLFLRENNLVPFQLHPKGWTILMAFHVLCCLKGVVPTLHLFQCFFLLRKCSDREGTFTIQRALRADSLFVDDIPKPPKKFYHHWFMVFPPEKFWNAPLRWCWTRPEPKKPDLSYLRETHANEIRILTSGAQVKCTKLLSSLNLATAQWGVAPDPLSSSHRRSSSGETPTKENFSHSESSATPPVTESCFVNQNAMLPSDEIYCITSSDSSDGGCLKFA